ncbi:hypothetical protein Tco_1023786 [Tanacetum coccineum]
MSRKQSFYTCWYFKTSTHISSPPPEYVSSQVSSAHRVTNTDIVSATQSTRILLHMLVVQDSNSYFRVIHQLPETIQLTTILLYMHVLQDNNSYFKVHHQNTCALKFYLTDCVTDTDIVSATRINSVNNNPSTHAGSSRQQPVFQGNYE